jgi:hypothetical protein
VQPILVAHGDALVSAGIFVPGRDHGLLDEATRRGHFLGLLCQGVILDLHHHGADDAPAQWLLPFATAGGGGRSLHPLRLRRSHSAAGRSGAAFNRSEAPTKASTSVE